MSPWPPRDWESSRTWPAHLAVQIWRLRVRSRARHSNKSDLDDDLCSRARRSGFAKLPTFYAISARDTRPARTRQIHERTKTSVDWGEAVMPTLHSKRPEWLEHEEHCRRCRRAIGDEQLDAWLRHGWRH